MLTEKDYCDKDLSLALKEVGYIGQGRCYYDIDKEPNKLRHFGIQVLTTRSAEALSFVLAVHLYDAQKWLREEKNIDIQIMISDHNLRWYYVEIYRNGFCKTLKNGYAIKNFITYEKALLEGVRISIKILQDEQKENN